VATGEVRHLSHRPAAGECAVWGRVGLARSRACSATLRSWPEGFVHEDESHSSRVLQQMEWNLCQVLRPGQGPPTRNRWMAWGKKMTPGGRILSGNERTAARKWAYRKLVGWRGYRCAPAPARGLRAKSI
jgi:hypothetical protein